MPESVSAEVEVSESSRGVVAAAGDALNAARVSSPQFLLCRREDLPVLDPFEHIHDVLLTLRERRLPFLNPSQLPTSRCQTSLATRRSAFRCDLLHCERLLSIGDVWAWRWARLVNGVRCRVRVLRGRIAGVRCLLVFRRHGRWRIRAINRSR